MSAIKDKIQDFVAHATQEELEAVFNFISNQTNVYTEKDINTYYERIKKYEKNESSTSISFQSTESMIKKRHRSE